MRIVTCVTAFLFWTPVLADDWSTTFAKDVLPDALVEARLVVATGGPRASEAGRVLKTNLEAAGSPLVIINPVMGDVDGVTDEEVVRRLSHLPVDAVVIVRTFGADGMRIDEDQEPTSMALVAFYQIDGTAIAGFIVRPGEPLTSEQRRNIGRGISQKTVDAVRAARHPEPEEGFVDPSFILGVRSRKWVLLDPDARESVRDAEIYRRLNRDDLAAAYERRERRLHGAVIGTGVAGGLAVAGGGILWVIGSTAPSGGDSSIVGTREIGSTALLAGSMTLIASAALWVYATGPSVHPLSSSEMQALVNDVNDEREEAREREREVDGEQEETRARDREADNKRATLTSEFGRISLQVSPIFVPREDPTLGLSLRLSW